MLRRIHVAGWVWLCVAMVAAGAAVAGERGQGPILFPHVWKMVSDGQTIALGKIGIASPAGDERLEAAATAWLSRLPQANDGPAVSIALTDWSGDAGKLLARSFPDVTPDALGDQGYLLAIQPGADGTGITIAGANERARFYGLQTLEQLVEGNKLCVVTIADKPTLSRRGVPAGGWWWRNRARLIPMYASLKLNYIYAGGEMLEGKMGGPEMRTLWRQPFSEQDKRQLSECLELARANFIDISIQMCPRGEPPVTYCSDEDIDLTVGKLAAMYEIGYRKFGINFDDLQNIGQNKVITEADKAKFGEDLGEAHRYFVEQVYARLKQGHPDIEFSFCPLYYSGFRHMSEKGRQYLLSAGKLPKEIQLVTCPESEEETALAVEWTGRPQLIWDNQIADRGGTFVAPLSRSAKYTDRDIAGYLTLLSQGDPFQVGYRSMADYMWSPERYDVASAGEAALVKALGSVEAAEAVKSYREVTAKLEGMRGYPLLERDARYAAMKADLEVVRRATEAMEKVVPAQASAEARRQTASLGEMVEALGKRMESQPYPVRVPRVEAGKIAIASDVSSESPSAEWSRAAELSDFIALRGNKPAQAQTTARLLHDGKNLLVRVVCEEPNPAGILAKHRSADEPVYDDDSVELFFITDPEGNDSRQVVVNTLGTLYGGVKCDSAVHVGAGRWVAEFSIPMEALGAKGVKAGDAWRFNIGRSRYQEKADPHSSYSPLFSRTFGVPSRFWPLVFE